MRSSEVTKTENPKTEPQKTRVKKSLIDSPHPKKSKFDNFCILTNFELKVSGTVAEWVRALAITHSEWMV